MKRTLLFFLSLLFIPASAFAAPKYERVIDVSNVSTAQPIFVSIPKEITLYHPLASLRVLRDGAVIPLRTSPAQSKELGGIIASIDLCSVEEGGKVNVLHDGDTSTTVRPDPLKNPQSCDMVITFSQHTRVSGVSLIADRLFTNIGIFSIGVWEDPPLGGGKNTMSVQFSEVSVDKLKIMMFYETVPELREIVFREEA